MRGHGAGNGVVVVEYHEVALAVVGKDALLEGHVVLDGAMAVQSDPW